MDNRYLFKKNSCMLNGIPAHSATDCEEFYFQTAEIFHMKPDFNLLYDSETAQSYTSVHGCKHTNSVKITTLNYVNCSGSLPSNQSSV